MAISIEQIVQAAIAILNRGGLDELSMRTLAAELNVKAASLYWHVKNKDELLEQVAEAICAKVDVPPYDGEDAQSCLFHLLVQYRTRLLEVRDASEILVQTAPRTPRRVAMIRYTFAQVERLGVSAENCVTAANLVNNFLLSFVAEEVRSKTYTADTYAEVGELLGIDSAAYFTDFDSQFNYGLNVLFAGFRAIEDEKQH